MIKFENLNRSQNVISLLLLLFLAQLMLSGCKARQLRDVYTPKELADTLKHAGGWAPLPFPDSKFRPGAIISIPDDDKIRWIGHLRECGFPDEVLEPEVSRIPGIVFGKDSNFEAKSIINYYGIEAGPQFGRISKVRLEIKDQGADAFRLLTWLAWLDKPGNREQVSPRCMEELLKPNYYLVNEAFRISKAAYTLLDKSGTVIKLKGANLPSLLKFEPTVKHNVTTEGKLVIEEPTYFAVRKVKRVGDSFSIGFTHERVKTADAKIEEIFLRTAIE